MEKRDGSGATEAAGSEPVVAKQFRVSGLAFNFETPNSGRKR
jgi:hypothetical protein